MKLSLALLCLLAVSAAFAQLPAPNSTGVATGHVHLTVPDAARHKQLWLALGAEETSSGRLQLLRFPGMFFILREREPTGPSSGSSVDHVGFLIQSYDSYKRILSERGIELSVDNPDRGQLIAQLPDGVRVEFFEDESIEHAIEFHHIHLASLDQEGLRDWYVDVFGAEASSRNRFLSALVPGGRVDISSAEEAPAPTRGRAIDHIGFEVADMDAFAARLRAKGIDFDREPAEIEAIGLSIAFITDPAGTYIELTEGLAGK